MDLTFIHSPVFGFVLFWILSGAAYSLPEPDANSSKFYLWAHSFAHFLLANMDRMKAGFKPPDVGEKKIG